MDISGTSDEKAKSTSPSFIYNGDRYYYDPESVDYETTDGKKKLENVPHNATDLQGFIDGFIPGTWWEVQKAKFKQSKFSIYILGIGEDNKNILQRGLGIFGYGNENFYWNPINTLIGALLGWFLSYMVMSKEGNSGWHLIGIIIGGIGGSLIGGLLGLIPVILGGIICFGLTRITYSLLKNFKGTSQVVDDILDWPLFNEKMTLKVFVGFYTLIFGSIFLLLNFPVVSILKPLLWPLFTDFGSSLLPIFSPFNKLMVGLGTYILRGIIFGIFTFLILILIMILFKGHKLITDMIIHYQSEKRRIKMQQRVDNLSYLAQAADIFANAGKKPRD